MTVPVGADGALGLYSAVADAFAGRRPGFGRYRAALAARFARFRGTDERAAASVWIAAALAEIGLIDAVVPNDAPARLRARLNADMPLRGAHIVAALAGVPADAADLVRWHLEHDDGTGTPDGLRWDGIPPNAAAIGVAQAFLAAIEDPAEPREPLEALFTLGADAGRRFSVDVTRAFHAFVTAQPDVDAPYVPPLPAIDEDAALALLTDHIDARDERTRGTSGRLASRAAALAERLALDASRAARGARLLALGRGAEPVPDDTFDPLSRFARDRRASYAQRASAIVAGVARFAEDAPALAASAAWYEDGTVDPYAALLAVVVAADGLDPLETPRRLAAAAGTQLHPDVTRAYLQTLGATT